MDFANDNGHVAFQRFGLADENASKSLDSLLRELPAVKSTTTEIILRSYYQTEFGIFDHEKVSQNRPLALVALHQPENAIEGGELYSHIRKFHSHQIGKLFNLSLVEFLDLPPYVVRLIYDIAKSENTVDNKNHNQALKQLNMDLD